MYGKRTSPISRIRLLQGENYVAGEEYGLWEDDAAALGSSVELVRGKAAKQDAPEEPQQKDISEAPVNKMVKEAKKKK
jgi:hypothetical protein